MGIEFSGYIQVVRKLGFHQLTHIPLHVGQQFTKMAESHKSFCQLGTECHPRGIPDELPKAGGMSVAGGVVSASWQSIPLQWSLV